MFKSKKAHPVNRRKEISWPIVNGLMIHPESDINIQKRKDKKSTVNLQQITRNRENTMKLILSFLPKPAMLNLRLVSRVTCNMVDYFPTLQSQFPPPSPPFENLTHLHIILPFTNPFPSLLTLRSILESATLPQLTHLTTSPLTISSLLALRWGHLTSYIPTTPTSTSLWRTLKTLSITLTPWWIPHHHSPSSSPRERRDDRDTHRTNLKILHSYLATFATWGSLHTLKFCWAAHRGYDYDDDEDGEADFPDGPNPLICDIIAATAASNQGRRRHWFSAPPIRWHGLRE
ncbi:hypothetical protein ACLMJK_009534, partial [Lecanora helva]